MIAMLLAAQLSAEIVRGMPADIVLPNVTVERHAQPLAFRRDGLAVTPQVFCKSQGAMQTSGPSPALLLRPQDRAAVSARKLADLPKANKEVAVARFIGGCAVPVAIQYGVEGDGTFAKGDGR